MAKKPSSLRNRLARHQADWHSRVCTALLTPTDEERSLFEVAWDALRRSDLFDIADADALAERFTWLPAFDSTAATGWIAGILSGALAYPAATDPLSDPRLCALEADVIAALGPEARWHANGDHPLPGFVPAGKSQGWWPITTATFDRAVVGATESISCWRALTRTDEGGRYRGHAISALVAGRRLYCSPCCGRREQTLPSRGWLSPTLVRCIVSMPWSRSDGSPTRRRGHCRT